MRSHRLLLRFVVAGTMLAGVMRADAVDRTTGRRHEPARAYVAVIGAVRQAGVYEVPAGNLPLWELIEQAGGFSGTAHGPIRVVRNGRVAAHTHVATGMRTPLRSGDVVVVAGKRKARRRKDAVEVALVGLLDRPVVLRLRQRDAILPTLVSLLGQSSDVGAAVRILSGSSSRNRSSSIADESVLVFDPRMIRRGRIPGLPQPLVRTRSQRPSSSSRIAVPPGRTNEPSSGGRRVRTASLGSDDGTPGVLRMAPPKMLGDGDSGMAASGDAESQPRMADEPTLERADWNAPQKSPVVNLPEPTAPGPAAAAGSAADIDLVERAAALDAEVAKDTRAAIDPVTMIIGIFAALGVLSAAVMLWSMGRRAMVGSPVRKPTDSSRTRLQQLLHDELAICEETPLLSQHMEFFGTPGTRRRLRADGPGMAGRPFLRGHKQQAGDETIQPVPAMMDEAGRRADPPEAVPPQPATATTAIRSSVPHEEVR